MSLVHRRRRSLRAFTLLELIVTLVVLGLLAAIAIPTYQRIADAAAERAETTSLESVARAAAANAAADRAAPPAVRHFQTAFDETPSYGAAGAGLAAQGGNVAVRGAAQWGSTPPAGAKVFWHNSDGAVAAIISVSDSTEDRCVVASVRASTVAAAVINPDDHGADADDPIAVKCHPVVALNWANETDDAVPPSEVPEPELEAPEVPANFAAAPGTTWISLSWDPVADAAHYNIAKGGDHDNLAAVELVDTTWDDTGLTEGTAYSYQVQACATTDLCSEWSDALPVTTSVTPPPAVPAAPVAAVNYLDITLTWAAVDTADSYDVRIDGTVEVSGHTGTTLTVDETVLASITQATTYEFAVRACSAAGCSEFSEVTAATTGGTMYVAATSIANANNSVGTPTAFTVPAGVTSLQVVAAGAGGSHGKRCLSSSGGGTAGAGGGIRATVAVTPGDSLQLLAGRRGYGPWGGWPGGGSSDPEAMVNLPNLCGGGVWINGAGGGYSGVQTSAGTPLVIAGGGGGGANAGSEATFSIPGNGGDGGAGGDGSAGTGGRMELYGIFRALGGGAGSSSGTAGAGGHLRDDNNVLRTSDWTWPTNTNFEGFIGNAASGRTGGDGRWPAGGGGGGFAGGGSGALFQNSADITTIARSGAGGGGGGGSSYAAPGSTGVSGFSNGVAQGYVRVCYNGHPGCS